MARIPGFDEPPQITAVLGPTNTGKTHRAIERMLQHRSGMIGLPLRLLAREVYDRVVARKGTDQVALVTGEQKILPPAARYWICTVEAMPEKRVAFLAVDEIQLASDRQRGRVFTDRLLHARGLFETMFLGSDTIAGLVEQLVPGALIDSMPRMSQLTHAGVHKLRALPKRSAIVAFSADHVYEIAERLRSRRGGAAVVLGALSPRARNAQVAMYQAGEVQYIVATDAIGMGLNLDVDHVSFSAVQKYDGRRHRKLTTAELAQIAGRAGRHRRDGTFGSTKAMGPLEPDVVSAIERHNFAVQEQVFWRNSDLDFRSVDALLASLRRRPNLRCLILDKQGEDQGALEDLARSAEVQDLASDPDGVRLLWQICQVPDYRKTLTGSHVELLGRVFGYLRRDGVLPDSWVAGRIARLDRTDGDIDTLMARIAFVRTWTYLSFQRDWMRDPKQWQERARTVEDRLSDALHARLTERFVDTERRHRVPSAPAARVLDAPDGSVEVAFDGRMHFAGQTVARLVGSDDVFRPHIKLIGMSDAAPANRQQLRVRLERRVRDQVDVLVGPLRKGGEGLQHAGRALLYLLERHLGSVPVSAVRRELKAMTSDERTALQALGVNFGQRLLWVPQALTDKAVRWRVLLWALRHRLDPMPRLPGAGLETLAVDSSWPVELYVAAGYEVRGPLAIRADLSSRPPR